MQQVGQRLTDEEGHYNQKEEDTGALFPMVNSALQLSQGGWYHDFLWTNTMAFCRPDESIHWVSEQT